MGKNIKAETAYGRNSKEALEYAEEFKDRIFKDHSAKVISIRRRYKNQGWKFGYIYSYKALFKKVDVRT